MSHLPRKASNGIPDSGAVPKAVVSRLSLYLRELERLERNGHPTINSSQLGHVLGFTDAQVRKDLAYFGQFGYPGIGYRTDELINAIRLILGTNQQWAAALIGAGNLGRALLGYKGFTHRGFQIEAVFDADPHKVGQQVEGREIYPLSRLPEIVRTFRIRLGLMAVPGTAAQDVANLLVEAGVLGIMNFAPVTISLPEQISMVSVDLAIELEGLSYDVVRRSRELPAPPKD